MEVDKKPADSHNPPILFTGGDPAGIGTELFSAILPALRESRSPLIYFCTAGPAHIESVFTAAAKSDLTVESGEPAANPRCDLLICGPGGDVDFLPGRPGEQSGALAFQALSMATDFALSHPIQGMVTAPLSKEWVERSGAEGFDGHTGYLASRTRSDVLMLMHGRDLSVIPLTVHVPLRDVADRLRKEIEAPAVLRNLLGLMRWPGYGPPQRWALTGLNPHAGDGGVIGSEELDYIDDFGDRLRRSGILIDGPLPADGLFTRESRRHYRLVLTCYHDQGLIPFKAIEGSRGINVTIGLPFLRTSPDHGTAFGIAGREMADPSSLIHAFRFVAESKSAEV